MEPESQITCGRGKNCSSDLVILSLPTMITDPSFAHRIWYRIQSIVRFLLRRVIRPAVPLWPWILAAVVFELALGTGQASILGQELESLPGNHLAIAGSVIAAFVVSLVGAALAQIAGTSAAIVSFNENPVQSARER